MTTNNENQEKVEIPDVEVLKSFNEAFNLARLAIKTGELKKAIEILEQLKECFEIENMIDMALDFAKKNVEDADAEEIEVEDELTEESLAKELLKLNPDAKIIKGKRKPKKVSLLKRFTNWVNQEDK